MRAQATPSPVRLRRESIAGGGRAFPPLLGLQVQAGNRAVVSMLGALRRVQRFEAAELSAEHDAGQPANCGPGTSNPFCLPIPTDDTPCTPFSDPSHAISVWAALSGSLPPQLVAVTRCGEVGPAYDEYFKATSAPFDFTGTSCVATSAKQDPRGFGQADTAAIQLFKSVQENLPVLVRDVQPNPLNPNGAVADLRVPIDKAINDRGRVFLHPIIEYFGRSAAAVLAGGVGTGGQGSDLFGDDDREMRGDVVIEVRSIDPETGAVSGQVRWVPQVHVKDTLDFCPGGLGDESVRVISVPMSKLEAGGLTRDVPLTIDYDLDLRSAPFTVVPRIGPLPGPGPQPAPGPSFPRSGPARTTGTLLRVRTGPGRSFPTLRLIELSGTPIQVETQIRGDPVDGNDAWDRIADGFVSDRFVAFDAGNVP
jgi:hypothetical protein